ncbi:HD domain-containing protein [Clostridium formicaceticum]|uniref:HD domain protein n=1 Tax=Clostridium formicaceticum TaxID=1497 RepID=A0AAC9WHA2_9CLOT|nr:HD domain-containing protein [Clostridium formicaceticum]AOY78103.1 hypothetical protein BJL90_20910 [Clostridium formicaceticum]ARE88753.1 HD domain protein [Clostridium formicaceticum]
MLYRIKQFFQGVTAKIYDEDIVFIKSHLSEKEQNLFFQLRKSEQRHCLNVAYGCHQEAPQNPDLVKAALLHDIGKIGSNLTLVNKSFVVIIQKLKLKGKMLPPFLQKALHYKNNHAELGYQLLLKLQLNDRILFLVRNHHTDHIKDSKEREMEILQRFDNLY